MSRTGRETWLLRVELPAGVKSGGRFVAALLKHLLRVWGIRCTAVLDAPAAAAAGSHQPAQDATRGPEAARLPPATPEAR